MKTARILATFIVTLITGSGALAQDYPNKPVRLIQGFQPGGATEILARIVGQKLTEMKNQPVVVEPRQGAGGTIAAGVVAKSPADGYTLLVHGAFGINAALYPNLPYDPLKDFVAIAPLATQPCVLVVGASGGLRTVAHLIAAAKARPGQVNFGSTGVGTATHLMAEKFRLATGIDVVHVPYKEGNTVNADVITGRVMFWFPPITSALSLIREGRLIASGVSSARRSSALPEVPTIAEAGVPGFESTIWFGMWAPAATPADVVDKLRKSVASALAASDVRDRLNKVGLEPMNMAPSEFAEFVRSEIDDSVRIVKAAGIKPQ